MAQSIEDSRVAAPGFDDEVDLSSSLSTTARTTQGSPIKAKNARRLRSGRWFSLAFGAALVVFVGSSVLPSIFGDTSTRAVITAPLHLITAPIDGEVSQSPLRAGDTFRAGVVVGAVTNPAVDRSALLQLETQALALAQADSETKAEQASIVGQTRFNASNLVDQRRELQGQNREDQRALAAQLASAQSRLAERTALLSRQEFMLRSGLVTEGYVDPARHKVTAARADVDAARANLDARIMQSRAVNAGVYGGSANILNGLHSSVQEGALAAARLRAQQRDVVSRRAAVAALILAERDRLDKLGSSIVVAREPGMVVDVAPVGRRVLAGATLISAVSCSEAVVAAIFPESKARGLTVGTPASVELPGENERRNGRIQKILPRTNEKADAIYSVPFPPTERRELYVLVALAPATAASGGTCPIGGWATVHLNDSAVPRSSTFVGRAQAAIAALFGQTPRRDRTELAQASR